MAHQHTSVGPSKHANQSGAAGHTSRNRWVSPIAFLASALLHAAVLVLPGGLSDSSPSHPVGDSAPDRADNLSSLKLIQLAPTPVGQVATAIQGPDDEPKASPGPDTDPARASITPGGEEAPAPTADPVRFLNTDLRLWRRFEATEPSVREQRRFRAQLQINALIENDQQGGLRFWGITIPIPPCESFLACELDFQRISELNDAFSRYLAIEQQGALTALYRQRLDSMRVRHGNRR